jgi:hypothetical protein
MLFGSRLPFQPEHKLFADEFIEGGQVFGDFHGQALEIVLLKDLAHQVPEQGLAAKEGAVEKDEVALGIDLGDDVGQEQRPNQGPTTPHEPDPIQGVGENGGDQDAAFFQGSWGREDGGDREHPIKE